MKHLSKPLLAAAIAFAGLAATSAAHARSDVFVSIGLGGPVGYVQPAPVYVQPAPVYVQPRSIYVQPQPVYYERYDRDDRYDRHDRDDLRDRRHHRRGPWGDADRDGVPNRYDRAPHNPYYR
jgi:hypothetical protein